MLTATRSAAAGRVDVSPAPQESRVLASFSCSSLQAGLLVTRYTRPSRRHHRATGFNPCSTPATPQAEAIRSLTMLVFAITGLIFWLSKGS